jgi:shikimate kinase
MATGKTTVGVELSKKIGYEFIDTDHEIEKRSGVTISEIFKIEGEASFRIKERNMISSISGLDRRVIACGGGALLDRENVSKLSRNSKMILLKASSYSILRRVDGDETRPLLNSNDREKSITKLMAERMPFYLKVADFVIETDKKTPSQLADEIISRLGGCLI